MTRAKGKKQQKKKFKSFKLLYLIEIDCKRKIAEDIITRHAYVIERAIAKWNYTKRNCCVFDKSYSNCTLQAKPSRIMIRWNTEYTVAGL